MSSKMSHCDYSFNVVSGFLSTITQPTTRKCFIWIGRNVYGHRQRFIALGFLVIILCIAGGSVYYQQICLDDATLCIENRSLYLWIPQKSLIWSQYTEILSVFGSYPSILTLQLTVNEGDSILTPSNMDTAFEIANSISNVTLYDHNDRDYEYIDLCTRSTPNQPDCDSSDESLFAVFFQNDPSFWNDLNITLTVVSTPGAPSALYLGGLEYADDDPSRIVSAQSLRIAYSLRGDTDQMVCLSQSTCGR